MKELSKIDASKRKDGLISGVTCNDGFWLSIQGGKGNYSSPREELDCIEHYDKMEIMTSELVPSLKRYQDGEDSLIYGYVPVKLIEALLLEHGGIKPTDHHIKQQLEN